MRPRVTVWSEHRHERTDPRVRAVYPRGIHAALAAPLRAAGFEVQTAELDDPDQGLSPALLDRTDVLVWWGHLAQAEVTPEAVERVKQRVLEGMGLVVLHSGFDSALFKGLLGTTCRQQGRDAGERERVWVIEPDHPIARGIPESFTLPQSEMYSERFDIPRPDELVFISWFESGRVFRSGCCFFRGRGRIFFFGPGHETYPIFYHPAVQQVLANAAAWAAPAADRRPIPYGQVGEGLEPIRPVLDLDGGPFPDPALFVAVESDDTAVTGDAPQILGASKAEWLDPAAPLILAPAAKVTDFLSAAPLGAWNSRGAFGLLIGPRARVVLERFTLGAHQIQPRAVRTSQGAPVDAAWLAVLEDRSAGIDFARSVFVELSGTDSLQRSELRFPSLDALRAYVAGRPDPADRWTQLVPKEVYVDPGPIDLFTLREISLAVWASPRLAAAIQEAGLSGLCLTPSRSVRLAR
jgi:trehalose utilization protein